ncbi:MAG: ATP-binding protein [Deltaproteobacteria bacterium]|nr:ATP-binding protein [Deltaproteobacteria bacterium]
MINRDLGRTLRAVARLYPVVTVTGPRQSGKTTLCKAIFPRKPYVSLEALDVRDFAAVDPRGFLAEYRRGAVIDEVQNAPGLLSYLQVDVDENPVPGRFVLTGSQHLGLSAAVSQSLAGRTAILYLLPPGLNELERFPAAPSSLWDTLFAGAYPRIHDRRIPPVRWLSDYVSTYVQRDVRALLRVTELSTFATFLKLCAARTGQEVNLSALGSDAGITHDTARAWLSVLEASFICFRAPAWHVNVTSQAVKAPKLHFFDSGLACHLLGIRDPGQLAHHPLRGALFESWVASEIFKARAHRGLEPALYHYRDAKRLEVDLLVNAGEVALLVEAKSAQTIAPDFFGSLDKLSALLTAIGRASRAYVVYGGASGQRRAKAQVLPWHEIASVGWATPAEQAASRASGVRAPR